MKIKNVSKKYADVHILKNVSLELELGTVTAFIGPNGAGKSTLLATMSRLLNKDSGTIMIKGKEIQKWKTDELARELSILKQQQTFQVKMTVRELLSFGRFPYSKGRLTADDFERIEIVLGYLQMEELGDRLLDTLSGGQLQRAALAMILVQDTDYILLDEPLNNLDMKQSIIAMETLQKMAKELGKTVLVVLHDINFAASYADNIIAMKNGEICYMGSVDEVMCPLRLQEVFDVELNVETIKGRKYCMYNCSLRR